MKLADGRSSSFLGRGKMMIGVRYQKFVHTIMGGRNRTGGDSWFISYFDNMAAN